MNATHYNIFSSKIGKRILLRFILSALIPVILFSIFSNYTVKQQLQLQTYEQLHQSIKNYGLSIFQRLETINIQLKQLKEIIEANPSFISQAFMDNAELIKSYEQGIKRIALVSNNKQYTLMGKQIIIKENLMSHKFKNSKMSIIVDNNQDTQISNIYALYKINSSAYLIAEINPEYLWDAKIISPYDNDYCILSKDFLPIHCPSILNKGFIDRIKNNLENNSEGYFELNQGKEQKLFSYRALFLNGTFDADSWLFVISRNSDDILLPISNFIAYLILTTILAISLVLFLSITQIRRVLDPLKKLQEGTKFIARKDFDKKISVQSKDEFEELANSFNQMADNLNMQFYTLETLATIDRLILSSLNIEKIIDTLLTQLKLIIRHHFVSIFITDADDEAGVCLFYLNEDGKQKKLLYSLSDAEQELLAEKESITIDSGRDSQCFQGLLIIKEGKHFLFPFFHSKKLMGAIILTEAGGGRCY